MMSDIPIDIVRHSIRALYDEAFLGPQSAQYSLFLDQGAKSGVIPLLRGLDAETVSRSPGPGRRSIVSHARHVLVYIESGLAHFRGNPQPVDWPGSFEPGEADAVEWKGLVDRLEASVRELRATLDGMDLANEETLTAVMAAAPHTAYHLGAMRQILLDAHQRSA